MKRQSISLPDEHWAFLEREASREGASSVSELLRWLVRDRQKGYDNPLRPIASAPRMQLLDIRTPDDEFYYAMVKAGPEPWLWEVFSLDPSPIRRLSDAVNDGWLWRYPR